MSRRPSLPRLDIAPLDPHDEARLIRRAEPEFRSKPSPLTPAAPRPLPDHELAAAALAAFWATVAQLHPRATSGDLPPQLVDEQARFTLKVLRAWRAWNDPDSCSSCGRRGPHPECSREWEE